MRWDADRWARWPTRCSSHARCATPSPSGRKHFLSSSPDRWVRLVDCVPCPAGANLSRLHGEGVGLAALAIPLSNVKPSSAGRVIDSHVAQAQRLSGLAYLWFGGESEKRHTCPCPPLSLATLPPPA